MKKNREQRANLEGTIFYFGLFTITLTWVIFCFYQAMYIVGVFSLIFCLLLLHLAISFLKEVKNENKIILQELKNNEKQFDDDYREMLITILNNLNELRKTDVKVRDAFPSRLLNNLKLHNFWRSIEVVQQIEKQRLVNSGLSKLTEEEKKALGIEIY